MTQPLSHLTTGPFTGLLHALWQFLQLIQQSNSVLLGLLSLYPPTPSLPLFFPKVGLSQPQG